MKAGEFRMKKKRFSETQIIKILKEAESGVPVNDLARQHSFGKSTFYNWKAKYGGMESSDLNRLKELEAENRRLKEMYAELSLENRALKDVIEKKG
jgi:putative transposase